MQAPQRRAGGIRVTYFEEEGQASAPPMPATVPVAPPPEPVPVAQPAAARPFDIERSSLLELDGNVPLASEPLSPDVVAERAKAMKIVQNRLAFEADAWYQFLQLLEGSIGRRDANWVGAGAGSQAVVQIFTNMLASLSSAASSGLGALTGSLVSAETRKELERNFTEGLSSILVEASNKARGLDDEGVRALTTALFANLHAERDLKLLERAVKIVKEASELPNDLIGPRIRQALGLGGGGLDAVAPRGALGADPPIPLDPLRPPPPPPATPKAATLPVAPAPPAGGGSSVAPPPLSAGATLLEREVKAATNADFQLYMALREGRVTDAWLKGFQMLYKRDADDQRISRSIEVIRAIERLLQSTSGRSDSGANALALYMAPENLGMLFLDQRVRAAIRAAHADLCTIGGRPDVPIIDWATAESSVQVRFAELCSIKYHTPTGATPFRGSSVYSTQSNARDVLLLCRELGTAVYVNNQLVFPGHTAAVRVRMARQEARAAAYEATGDYHGGGGGAYNALSNNRTLAALELGAQGGRKRPLGPGELAAARRRAQRAADQRLAAQLLLD